MDMEEKQYLLKCIDWIEKLPPSQALPGVWLKMKATFIPRLKKFINGGKEKDIVEEAKDIFNETNTLK